MNSPCMGDRRELFNGWVVHNACMVRGVCPIVLLCVCGCLLALFFDRM